MTLLRLNDVIPITPKVRRAVYVVFGGRCFYSGALISQEEAHVDHFIPKDKGGRDVVSNYVLSRSDLNLMKHTTSLPCAEATMAFLRGITGPRIIRILNREILRRARTESRKRDLLDRMARARKEGTRTSRRKVRLSRSQKEELRHLFQLEEVQLTLEAFSQLMTLPNGATGDYEMKSEHLEGRLSVTDFNRALVFEIVDQLTRADGGREMWYFLDSPNAPFTTVSLHLTWAGDQVVAGVNKDLISETASTSERTYFQIAEGGLCQDLLRLSDEIRARCGKMLNGICGNVGRLARETDIGPFTHHQQRFCLFKRWWIS